MNTRVSRRTIVKSASLLAIDAVANPVYSGTRGTIYAPVSADVPSDRLRELTNRALSSAMDAGASYADVRLTHTYRRIFASGTVEDHESMAVGVRALVKGFWGFAATPYWSLDEMARLGKEAAYLASLSVSQRTRPVELSPREVVTDHEWTTPIEIDAFTINPIEILDHIEGLMQYARRKFGLSCAWNTVGAYFDKRLKVFAASDGCFSVQRLYGSGGGFGFSKTENNKTAYRDLDEMTVSSLGWEVWKDPMLKEKIREKVAEIDEDLSLSIQPVEVGRYDMILDAKSTANLLSKTIGQATELDRALGFEANAGGTSYITDPSAMLGTLRIGSEKFTIFGNRSERGGAATVNLDDEGVRPHEFTVIDKGILSGFQTTRETGGWFSANGIQPAIPVTSNGCACATTGVFPPHAFPANLVMQPDPAGASSYRDVVRNLDKGIALEGCDLSLDMMRLNGLTYKGRAYSVQKGKKTAILLNVGSLFRTPELWKSLMHLGGEEAQKRYGFYVFKGEPPQHEVHSVTAVPTVFKDASVIDVKRKA